MKDVMRYLKPALVEASVIACGQPPDHWICFQQDGMTPAKISHRPFEHFCSTGPADICRSILHCKGCAWAACHGCAAPALRAGMLCEAFLAVALRWPCCWDHHRFMRSCSPIAESRILQLPRRTGLSFICWFVHLVLGASGTRQGSSAADG